MARTLLDTGATELDIGSDENDGTGDPIRTGGSKLKTWAADQNAMNAELYEIARSAVPVPFQEPISVTKRPDTSGTANGRNGSDTANDGVNVTYGYIGAGTPVNLAVGYHDGSYVPGIVGRDSRVHISFTPTAATYGITLQKNSVISSATLSFTAMSVGANIGAAGVRIHAKKTEQTTYPSNGDAAYQWETGGKLTTAYADVLPVNGVNTVDVTALINELLASSEWAESDHPVQFTIKSKESPAAQTTTASTLGVQASVSGGTSERLRVLTISSTQHAGNYETAELKGCDIINFLPCTASDASATDTLRFVVQSDSLTRESGTFVPADDAGGLFTGTVGNATAKTIKVQGQFVELSTWAVLPQARIFGRKYTNNERLQSSGPMGIAALASYTDGWRVNWRDKDYLLAFTCEFEGTAKLASYWDVWNYNDTYSATQSAIFVSVDAALGTVTFDCQAGNRYQKTVAIGSASAGRVLRVALLWDHLALRWRHFVKLEEASGASVASDDGTSGSTTYKTWNPWVTGSTNYDKEWLCGFRVDGLGGDSLAIYGHLLLEVNGSFAANWEDSADWMTDAWRRGIKSLDPRLMA